jgi:hypothetical protein
MTITPIMTIVRIGQSVAAAVLLSSPLAWAQTADAPNSVSPLTLRPELPERLNRISLSYRMGMNITVDFNKLGGFPALSDPGPATGSTFDRNYDNGSYNMVDSSGNLGGTTWYWGYESASQLQGNSLVMESSSSPANKSSKNNMNDPQHGFELSYGRQLYRHKNLRFGLEGGFGYTLVDASDSRTLFATVNRITDSFVIPGGVSVVPNAPYHGTFFGPGALMSSSPERVTSVISRDAVITGHRKIDSDVFIFRFGPYLEVPVYKQLSFLLGGGLSLVSAHTDFSYTETVTLSDTGQVSEPRSSSGSQSDFLVGGYVSGTLSYAVTTKFGLFAGVQFQSAGRSVTDSDLVNQQSVTKKEAVLDLGESILLVFGVSYSF